MAGPARQRHTARRRRSPPEPLRILYEDPQLIVIDKPAGLLAVPLERRGEETSAADQIEQHMRSHGKRRPLVVHRIDRDTSGVVLFAKDARTQAALKQQFRARTPERVYLAVVYGHPDPPAGTWRDHLVWDSEGADPEADASATTPRRPKPSASTAWSSASTARVVVEVRLTTGKRNQIRIQARLRGHTLVGEVRYTFGSGHASSDSIRTTGASRAAPWIRPSSRRQASHARGAGARRHEKLLSELRRG